MQKLTRLRRALRSVDKSSVAARNLAGAVLAVLDDRGVTSKASSQGPAPPSPGKKGKASPKGSASPSPGKKATPKKCHIKKPNVKRPHKRMLVKRVSKTVREGTVEEGDEADQLSIYSLKTCIGVIAVSGKKKVMAHINAEDAGGRDYNVQMAAFKTKA